MVVVLLRGLTLLEWLFKSIMKKNIITRILTLGALLLLSFGVATAQTFPVQNLNVLGQLQLGGSPGSSGNVLTSNGTSAPTWAPVSGGSIATNSLPLSTIVQQAANTVLANVTGATGNVTAFSMPSCYNAGGADALEWNSGVGFVCNAAINASVLGGFNWAVPGVLGSTTPNSATFTSGTFNTSLIAPTPAKSSNSTTVATTAYNASTKACANIMQYGGDNTGSFNNDTAFTNALASAVNTSNVKCVEFPPGQFNFSAQAVVSLSSYQNVTIKGQGADVTDLYWAGNGGLKFSMASGLGSVHVKDLTLLAGAANTGIGIYLAGTFTSTSSAAQNTIENVTIRDVNGYFGTNYFGNGINIDRVSNVNINNVYVLGGSTTNGQGLIIGTTSAGAVPIIYDISNSTFDGYGDGFEIGTEVQGVQIVNSNFTNDGIGIFVPGSETGLDQLSISNCQFNSVAGTTLPNIYLQSPFPNFTLSNSLFLVSNSTYGVYMTSTSTTTITGNSFESNSGSPTAAVGIDIAGWTNYGGVIVGNSFANLNTAIILSATSKNFGINSNVYQGNGTNISNGGCTGCSIGVATP